MIGGAGTVEKITKMHFSKKGLWRALPDLRRYSLGNSSLFLAATGTATFLVKRLSQAAPDRLSCAFVAIKRKILD